MAKREDVKKLAQFALEKMGKVDILVNNAGMNAPQPIDGITDETWDRVLEVNLTSVMSLTRAIVPQMKERRWGRVVHISSVLGQTSKEKRNAYSATKSALIGLARANALEARTSHGAEADAARVHALAAYKDFLALWKDADPDIPVYKQAKVEYARLQ